MGTYVPKQHTGRPMGDMHDTLWASLSLWLDEPPENISLGPYTYALVRDASCVPFSKEEDCTRNQWMTTW